MALPNKSQGAVNDLSTWSLLEPGQPVLVDHGRGGNHWPNFALPSAYDTIFTPSAPRAFEPNYGTPVNSARTARRSTTTYMAVVRRREVNPIRRLVKELVARTDQSDIVMAAEPIVRSINTAIERLLDAESEGNSREILRRLRDTFLDGGWKHYRDAPAQEAAIRVLDTLIKLENVAPNDVTHCTAILSSAGLAQANFPILSIDDEVDADGEENEEVSD